MKLNTSSLLLASSCAALLPLSAATVFSNNFEDGNFEPDIGSWNFAPTSALTQSVISTSTTGTTLGSNVGLIDQGSIPLDLTLNLTDTVSLADGNTVGIDFNLAARRTNGNSRTLFVDALDSNGDIVVRLVLGDAGAFGNGGSDRQRPGHDPTSAGNANTANTTFGAPPNSFWWGADTGPATFNTNVDAVFSLSIGESSFDFSSTGAFAGSFSVTELDNRDSGTFADVASIAISSAGTNYGVYIDNLVVSGVVVPEPSSTALLGFVGLGFLVRRKR